MARRPPPREHRRRRHVGGICARLQPRARRCPSDPRNIDLAGRRRAGLAGDQRRGRADVGDPVDRGSLIMETTWLLPDLRDPTTAPFWEGCARGELLVQACASCGLRRVPPRPMCPRCRSLEIRWEPTSGRGRAWSFLVPHPPLLPAFAEVAPYNAIIVELDEDPLIR